jgi:hypothetical protein
MTENIPAVMWNNPARAALIKLHAPTRDRSPGKNGMAGFQAGIQNEGVDAGAGRGGYIGPGNGILSAAQYH